MNAALAVTCLLAFMHSATRLSAMIRPLAQRSTADFTTLAIWPLLFFALFQAAFHLLGFAELATGSPVVTLANALGIALLFSAFAEYVWRRARRLAGSGFERRPVIECMRRFGRAIAAGGLLAYATVFVALLLAFVTAVQFPREFEVNAYHLPVGLHVFQEHSFRPWDSTSFHVATASASLFFAFLLQFLPERPASAANLFFAAALCIGAYGLARTLGADRRASTIAVAGLVTVPIVGLSALCLGSDVGGIAFLAIALYLIFARPLPNVVNMLLAGMAMGLGYGFKMYHAPSVAYASLLVLVGAQQRGSKLQGWDWRSALRGLTWFAIGSLATAGFWFARSYYHFGNPTYPLSLPLLSSLLGWSGAADALHDPASNAAVWVRSTSEWFAYPWIEWHRNALGFTISSGFGPFFAAAVPAAMIAAGVSVLSTASPRRAQIACLWLGVPLVLFAWWFSAQQPRYSIGALVYATPLVAYMICRTQGRCRIWVECVLGGCVAIALAIIVTKELVGFGDRIVLARQFSRAAYYEYPPALDQLPPGSKIAHIGSRSVHFQLFGPRLDFRVVSYPEVMRSFGLPGEHPNPKVLWPYPVPPVIDVRAPTVRSLGLTHLYVAANTELRPDSCVTLTELGALHRNPYNQLPLPAPRRLFKITTCE